MIWKTLESMDGERVVRQHCFKAYNRKYWDEFYLGNKALCCKAGIHDGEKFIDISEEKGEEKKPDCCKACEKIFNNLK